MANVIPSDQHVIGDPGHTSDHDNIADVLGLLAAVNAVQGNSDAVITSPPGGNATAVTALQNMLTHRTGYFPWRFSVVTYGAVGNGQMVVDGAVSTSTPTTLTCATSLPFSPAVVGMAVIVNGVLGSGSAGTGTITGYTSPGVVTVTWQTTPTTTVTSACVLYGTDDTAAFQGAITAATNFMNNNNLAAEVYKPQPPNGLFYMIAGPLVTTGSANGQLVIPSPFAVGAENLTLYFSSDITRNLPFWTQTAYTQVSNSIVSTGVFGSTGAYSSNFASFGKAGVISSTPCQTSLVANIDGLPAFQNIHVVFENWTIVSPSSANGLQYSAFQMGGVAKSEFNKCAALISTNYNTSSGANAFPPSIGALQNGLSTGIIGAGCGNNDDCTMDNPTVSGYSYGLQCGEHPVVHAGREIGCWSAIWLSGNDGVSNAHLTKIIGNSVELCSNLVYVYGSGASGFSLDADFDMESLPTTAILDSNSGGGMASLMGEIRVFGQIAGNLASLAPAYPVYVKIHAMNNGTSAVNSVPGWVFSYAGFSTAGTTVAVQNPYWKDCRVYYSGGTVTGVSAGVTLGGTGGSATTHPTMTSVSTAASGVIDWPCGGWLSFAFTGSPTWNVLVGF